MDPTTGAPSRRAILAGALAAPAVMAAAPALAQQQSRQAKPARAAAPLFAYVGTFTTEQRKARGEGISVYRVDPATGTWTHQQTLALLWQNEATFQAKSMA
jgi:6-phosphogluconolactonase